MRFPVLILLLSVSVTFVEEKIAAPKPGAVIKNFTLKDVHRRPRSLDGFQDKTAFVVAFLGAECPLANLAVPRLIELREHHVDSTM
jgi:hypothetical protein